MKFLLLIEKFIVLLFISLGNAALVLQILFEAQLDEMLILSPITALLMLFYFWRRWNHPLMVISIAMMVLGLVYTDRGGSTGFHLVFGIFVFIPFMVAGPFLGPFAFFYAWKRGLLKKRANSKLEDRSDLMQKKVITSMHMELHRRSKWLPLRILLCRLLRYRHSLLLFPTKFSPFGRFTFCGGPGFRYNIMTLQHFLLCRLLRYRHSLLLFPTKFSPFGRFTFCGGPGFRYNIMTLQHFLLCRLSFDY